MKKCKTNLKCKDDCRMNICKECHTVENIDANRLCINCYLQLKESGDLN